jgi:periplasmic protein TonB
MSKDPLYKEWETILFSGKNRAFGAYVLRQRQNVDLLKGILVSVVLVSLVYALPFLVKWVASTRELIEVRQVSVAITPYSELAAPPPIPLDEKKPEAVQEPPEVATKKFLKPELKRDDEVKDEELIPTIEELKEANPGSETREGTGDIHAQYEPNVVRDTAAAPAPAPKPPKKSQVYSYVQKFPEFPGGETVLQQFLVDNIVYPFIAKENNISGTVIVQFVIDEDGRIQNPVVARDIGGGCGEEAIRVVMMMPDWIPGEQHGKKVAVRYTLPVRFQLL